MSAPNRTVQLNALSSFDDVLKANGNTTGYIVYDAKCQPNAVFSREDQESIFSQAQARLPREVFLYYFIQVPGATFSDRNIVNAALGTRDFSGISKSK